MDSYRYGFQNQEKDDEIKGAGNSVNYKYRMHDPRVGRFFAVDPLKSTYPWYSTYQFSGNRPIDCVEIEGAEPKSVINSDGSLTKTAIKVLHALTGVEISLLQNVKVMNQNDNPINAPWFNRSNGGGGLTVGSTIYLTDNYFSTDGYSNKKGNTNYGSETGRSVFFWIKILSHEVGHLPQAESFGNDLIGKVGYFVNFSFGYLSGISKLNKKAHDTFSDEVTAELGSYVFDRLFFDDYPIKKGTVLKNKHFQKYFYFCSSKEV
jgi:RHS repeat-associated protein